MYEVIFMKTKKRAWIYTHVDAPEYSHGALKAQERELVNYVEQLGFTIVEMSSDLGVEKFNERRGIMQITNAAERGEFDVLLILNTLRISLVPSEILLFLQLLKKYGIQVISPLQGNITEEIGGEYYA
jgi:DNA invertase Pin-like site-specific DNA recombinase